MTFSQWGRLLAAPLFLSTPASAEQVPFKIVDFLWLQDKTYGEGVEIVYQFDRKPNDGDEALKTFALSECNRVAAKYVPLALEKAGESEADFVLLTFRFGGAFGTYVRWIADYENGVCVNHE